MNAVRNDVALTLWLLAALAITAVGAVIVERALTRVFDDAVTAALSAVNDDPFDEPDPFDPTNHRTNHPTCEVCRGIEARADHVWDALVAQLEGEQA